MAAVKQKVEMWRRPSCLFTITYALCVTVITVLWSVIHDFASQTSQVSVYGSLCVLFLKLWITKDTQIFPLMCLAKLFTPSRTTPRDVGYLNQGLQNHLRHLLLLALFLRTFGHQIIELAPNDTILCVPRNDLLMPTGSSPASPSSNCFLFTLP